MFKSDKYYTIIQLESEDWFESVQQHIGHSHTEPLNETLLENSKWCFQRDLVPGHKMKRTQPWLTKHMLDFITLSEWLTASPDFKPLDY